MNCPKGCGRVTEKQHCANKGCPWLVCEYCKIIFDPKNISRQAPWNGS